MFTHHGHPASDVPQSLGAGAMGTAAGAGAAGTAVAAVADQSLG